MGNCIISRTNPYSLLHYITGTKNSDAGNPYDINEEDIDNCRDVFRYAIAQDLGKLPSNHNGYLLTFSRYWDATKVQFWTRVAYGQSAIFMRKFQNTWSNWYQLNPGWTFTQSLTTANNNFNVMCFVTAVAPDGSEKVALTLPIMHNSLQETTAYYQTGDNYNGDAFWHLQVRASTAGLGSPAIYKGSTQITNATYYYTCM